MLLMLTLTLTKFVCWRVQVLQENPVTTVCCVPNSVAVKAYEHISDLYL